MCVYCDLLNVGILMWIWYGWVWLFCISVVIKLVFICSEIICFLCV